MKDLYTDLVSKSHPSEVAFIGNYLPRKCGIATFTHDVYTSFAKQYPNVKSFVISVNDIEDGYEYPEEVHFDFFQHNPINYDQVADYINDRNVEVVCLQHEYGIYGGKDGKYIIRLLEKLKMPIVTTFHTVLKEPGKDQYNVLREIASLSERVIVMTEKGKEFLINIYNIPSQKIDVIPHGIPDMAFVDPHFYKDKFNVEGKNVMLTFGLLSPNKGIENVIRALPEIISKFPDTVYIILGATHPNLLKEQGEAYRNSLQKLAEELNVSGNIKFHNQFVDTDSLKEFIGAADIYITPYLNASQITSGTLAYCFGCGKAVISTPYWHAEELLSDGRGILVPFGDTQAIADKVLYLLEHDQERNTMRKKAYMMGREMIWENVIQHYEQSFALARSNRWQENYEKIELKNYNLNINRPLPEIQTEHLFRMSDSTGMLQHATFHLPRFEEGYCSDDNARALILTTWLENQPKLYDGNVSSLGDSYAAFLNYAFTPETGQFKNFMSYDRRWLETVGSEDSNGRVIWSLGCVINQTHKEGLKKWATELFLKAVKKITSATSPRTWAYSLFGISEYLKKYKGDRNIKKIRKTLTDKLASLFNQVATETWPWFEEVLSYDNARLCQAMLVSEDPVNIKIGMESLKWLKNVQTSSVGHFRPIGCEKFYKKDDKKSCFDQQPIEAAATVSACLSAFQVSRNPEWINEAQKAFDWFLGKNDVGISIYDTSTGGCYDGLQVDRVNQNQGAESTLAYLMALTELKQVVMMQQTYKEDIMIAGNYSLIPKAG